MTKYLCKGAIVKAIAGREINEIFIITHVENGYAYLVNGKSRPIENPKKKNIKHLQLLQKSEFVALDFNNLTNTHIIKIIKDFKKSKDYK